MPVPSVTQHLSKAGERIIEMLAARAQDLEDSTGDPLYTGIDNWCQAVLHSSRMEAAFDLAQQELEKYYPDPAASLQNLGALLAVGDPDADLIARDIWLFYVFNIESVDQNLWETYPRVLRSAVFSAGHSIPQSWSLWTMFVHDFMTLFTQIFEEEVDAFPRLFTEEAVKLLEMLFVHEEDGLIQPDRLPNETLNYRVALSAYLVHVMNAVGYFSLGSYPGSMNAMVPIDEVYIPLNLVTMDQGASQAKQIRYQTAQGPSQSIATLRSPLDPAVFDECATTEIAEVLRSARRILLLGENGAGKTVLSRYLACENARLLAASLDEGGGVIEMGPDGGLSVDLSGPVPIWIDLGDYIENSRADESLDAFFLRIIESRIREADVATLLQALLADGRCLLLLDGLDQANTDERRRHLLIQVTQSADRWVSRGNQVIVTCRLEGYESAPLPDTFRGYILCSPSRNQVNKMVLKWRMTLAKYKQPFISEDNAVRQAQSDTLSLLNNISWDPRLFRLVRTPLILRMLVEVYRADAAFVPRRAAIYDFVARSMLYNWHLPHLPEDRPVILHQEITDILSALAFWLQGARPTGTLNAEELRLIIGNAWSELHPDLADTEVAIAVDELLDTIQHYSGVLIRMDRERYRFAFSGLQEYFAALYLISSYRQAPERIRMRLHDPTWNSVIRLGLGLMAMRSRDDASDLIDIAVLARGELAEKLGYDSSPFEDLMHRDLFFASRLLCDDVEVRPDIVSHVLDSVLELWRRGEASSTGRFDLVFDAARRHLTNLDQTSYSLNAVQACLSRVDIGTERQRAYTIDALTFWHSHRDELNRLVNRMGEEKSTLVRFAFANSLGFVEDLSREAYLLLLSYAVDDDRRISKAALNAIERASPIPHEALRVWDEFLGKNDARRRVSLHMLSELGSLPPRIIDRLLGLIHNSDTEIQIRAIRVLGHNVHLPDNALYTLFDLTDNPNDEIRAAAVEALIRPVELPEEILSRLEMLVHDNNRTVRSKAVEALSTCTNNSSSIFNTLLEQLNAPTESQREAVIMPLLIKGGSDARIPAVLRHAAGQALSIRRKVAEALRHYAAPSPEIRRLILALLRDADESVRRAMLQSVATMKEPGDDVIVALSAMAKVKDSPLLPEVIHTLASIRPLPDEVLLTLVNALPQSWEKCGDDIRTALLNHLPLSATLISRMKKLAFAEVPDGTRIPTHLRAIAVETLRESLSDPLMLKNVLKLAVGASVDVRLRIAAIQTVAFSTTMSQQLKAAMLHLIDDPIQEIRVAAGVALGRLVYTLPDHGFDQAELFDIAHRLALMLDEVPVCASWEEESLTQNEVYMAMTRVVSRIRPEPPQLMPSLENSGGELHQQ